ncbi:hybrid sensor histidine kinase/response regulator [Roseococcus suduntuyensis]|uniref:histidine kinase n=1 Tax=Roseococcus suduntuyensis TaxID=455361 RepID=A0A840ADM3_9PROT|nr:ATP-binding protein [Roseococcus suduntuyensis]MBB3898314.1 signal transduction histidine kinase/CheY-like chemotaxis protein [Roseococcus suduntuyensis]
MQTGRLLRAAVVAAGLIILLAQIAANLLLTERAHRSALDTAEETVTRVARSVEATMNRTFLQVDSLLLGLPTLLSPFEGWGPGGSFDRAAAGRLLRELNNQNLTVRDILLVGPGGPEVSGLTVSRRRALPIDLARDLRPAGLPGAGLQLAGPVRNPGTGEWSLFFARNVSIQGLGAMMAVAEMPVAVVTGLLGAGGEPEGLRVSLEMRDGTLLATLPPDEARMGQRLDRAVGQGLVSVSRFDGTSVIGVERPTLYPSLAISVSLDRDVALAAWRVQRDRAAVVATALTLLVLAVVAAMLVALRQRARVDEERLRWRRTLENALESMTDGFVMFDAEDRLVICNQRYREFYAESAPFIEEGAFFDDIIRGGVANGQYPQFEGDVDGFIAELKVWRRSGGAPIERLLPDGRWILITERPTPDGGTVGIRTDITALKEAVREVEAAAEAKSMFLARMSHELRTPLNAILGFAGLLLSDRSMTPAHYEQLRLLHEAGSHVRELVNGLLDLAKINAGKLELEQAPLALTPLLEGCLGFLSPDARRKQITLRMVADPDLPAGVLGDATRLRQMILNLLSNAVKFTPVGGRVELRVRPISGGIRVEVQDSGPGVPREKRHLLFQDFTQLGELGDPESPGTGLGLAITARLVALMQGRIGVESEPGQGAMFWVEVPLAEATPPREPAQPGMAGGSVRPLRLLVADDIAPNRLLMRALLGAAGHEVTVVTDGAEALAAVQSQPFDAVLMDVRMPGMDGLEATRRLRALPGPEARLPVIAVTASALPEEITECRAAGMDTHVAKPVDRAVLLGLLARITAGPEAPPAEAVPPDPVAALRAELGEAALPLLHGFMDELDEVAAALEVPGVSGQILNALIHRGQGAAASLGDRPVIAALEAAHRRLREGEAAPAVLAGLRPALRTELPRLRAALEKALGPSAVAK